MLMILLQQTVIALLQGLASSDFLFFFLSFLINAIEYQMGNQKMTIQRNWQHRVQRTQKKKQQQQQTNKKIPTQHVLDTTIRKQTQVPQN